MLYSKKTAALAAGFVAMLSAISLAQGPKAPARGADPSSGEVLVLDHDATIEWIEKADVAALREGVLSSMELKIGMPVEKGGVIGMLHDEIAALTVAKAKLAADGKASEEKAIAQKELAETVVARNQRLQKYGANLVSKEDVEKAIAEVKVAAALQAEAVEKRALDNAEYELAKQVLREHVIRAPFSGVVYERLKNPGESVRANEPVVRLGNLDKLRAYAYAPLAFASRIKEGQVVDIQILLDGGEGGSQPLEQKRFRGKITFVDPQVAPVADQAVRIFAEFENKEHELRPGFKAKMTVYLNTEGEGRPARTVGVNAPAIGR
jgi:RND family efflux transporter MFP subunit